jgi:hypothetical protein
MKGINRILMVGGVLCAFAAGSHVALGADKVHIGTAVTAHSPIAEDSRFWDCATMGNHRCGEYRTGVLLLTI